MSKYPSFQRQLNIYGFQRLTAGPDKGGYYHELFLRSKPGLAYRIQRHKLKGTGTRKAASPESEPDFYKMPSLPVSNAVTPKGSSRNHGTTAAAKSGCGASITTGALFGPPSVYEHKTQPQGGESSLRPQEQHKMIPPPIDCHHHAYAPNTRHADGNGRVVLDNTSLRSLAPALFASSSPSNFQLAAASSHVPPGTTGPNHLAGHHMQTAMPSAAWRMGAPNPMLSSDATQSLGGFLPGSW